MINQLLMWANLVVAALQLDKGNYGWALFAFGVFLIFARDENAN